MMMEVVSIMNDFDPNKMSRSARSKKQKFEPKFSRESDHKKQGGSGLRIFLIVAAFAILSSVPIYGAWANRKTPEKQATPTTSSKTTTDSSQKKSSSSEQSSSQSSSTTSESSEESVSSSSEVQSSETDSAETSSSATEPSSSSSAATNTAVLGSDQTLYNFAMTHGMTTDQVVALNPGLSVSNYTQYSGQNLNIQ